MTKMIESAVAHVPFEMGESGPVKKASSAISNAKINAKRLTQRSPKGLETQTRNTNASAAIQQIAG